MPRIYDFDDFLKHVYGKEGSIFTSVKGPNGSGKERIQALGLGEYFGSNMPTPESVDRPEDVAIRPNFKMDFIEDLKTLEQRCRLLNTNPEKHGMKPYYFFLSELGKFVPKDEAWNKANREFIQALQTVRKYGLRLFSDFIDRVDERILSPFFFTGMFHKPYPENPRFATYEDLRTGRTFTFKNIPRCKMWFNTYYTANFYIEPQSETCGIALDQTEEIVKTYRETGSWKKAGVTTMQGKRELFKVIDRYFSIRTY